MLAALEFDISLASAVVMHFYREEARNVIRSPEQYTHWTSRSMVLTIRIAEMQQSKFCNKVLQTFWKASMALEDLDLQYLTCVYDSFQV